MIIPFKKWKEDYICVEVDLDDAKVQRELSRWGGHTFFRITFLQNGKKIHTFVSARISGDVRAGSTSGAHLQMSVAKKSRDTVRTAHALPCWPVKEVGEK